MIRRSVIAALVLALVLLTALITRAATGIAAEAYEGRVFLYDAPAYDDPHAPQYILTKWIGSCTPLNDEVFSASNASYWKIRFYRSAVCDTNQDFSTMWEVGSGHTTQDPCVCFTRGGAQSWKRIAP